MGDGGWERLESRGAEGLEMGEPLSLLWKDLPALRPFTLLLVTVHSQSELWWHGTLVCHGDLRSREEGIFPEGRNFSSMACA